MAEALGRKMIAVEELHGPAAAHNVAEQYLHRFPRGGYAGAARALCVDGARLGRAESVAGGNGDPVRVPMSIGAR